MAQYQSSLTGPQIDAALEDMAEHNSEAWAVGTREGVAVSSGDATYQNNAKYYSTQASTSATSASSSASNASTSAGAASTSATNAANSATAADNSATLSQSWAIGGTGTRTGEDTNNAKYWSEQAAAAAGGGVASFNGRSGAVLPQTGDYTAAMVGALPSDTVIPTKTSDLTNDSGYITSSANISGTAAGLSATLGVDRGGTGRTTLTSNAILTGNGTTAVNMVPTAVGAAYATAANGALTFGTLPVGQGGTGASTFTANSAIISGSTTTGAFTTRAITNNTATSTALTANTNLITANTLRYHTNRTTSVAAADTNYTTYMARGVALVSTDTTPTNNGQIAWVYA